jgi:hypothetical protein
MQRPSKVLGWKAIGNLHQIRRFGVRKLASLHNTMNKKSFMVGKFLTMPYPILFELQV